jgi:acyl-CoA dehydrogenase
MDFEIPEDLQLLKNTVRRFVDSELIPIEREICEGEHLKPDYKSRLEQRAKDLGLWMMDVPEQYGGSGLGVLARVIVWEELSRTIAIPARSDGIMGPAVRGILYDLTGEMKERYLLPVLRGEKRACFAQSEPDAGSDPGSMQTTAVRNDDHYVVNGVKRWITDADRADFMQLMAATDRSKGSHGGISCFIVDMNTPGVSVPTKYKTMMGDEPCEVVLNNVKVPVSHRVGAEGEGFKLAQQWIGIGRIKHGARALGVAQRCLELAASYARQRVTFGRPLADRQSIQWMLVDSHAELETARLLVYRAAVRLDRGRDVRQECYLGKYYADEMAFKVADRAMQIHGGMGLCTDLPIEKFWRNQRSFKITEGATEVMKMVIARDVLRIYAK